MVLIFTHAHLSSQHKVVALLMRLVPKLALISKLLFLSRITQRRPLYVSQVLVVLPGNRSSLLRVSG